VKATHLSEDEVQLHLDGLVPPGDLDRVTGHLDACAQCRALVRSFQALGEALDRLPLAEPPADFTLGVLARIDERQRAAARERRLAAIVLGVTVGAMASTVALAGQSAWAPVLSEASAAFVQGVRAVRISGAVLSPVVGALRLPIAVACSALGLPLLLGLSRLLPARHRPAT
jgi:anti-sigma factor RsiW